MWDGKKHAVQFLLQYAIKCTTGKKTEAAAHVKVCLPPPANAQFNGQYQCIFVIHY